MTFEQFVAEVCAHPKDAALRTMFADWLLERGDPRGEALALEGHDKKRTRALQKKHARTWLGSFADVVELEACRFRGGFPTALTFRPGEGGSGSDVCLAFVESCTQPPGVLLESPALGALQHLSADLETLLGLQGQRVAWKLQTLEVWLWRTGYSDFRRLSEDLDRLADVACLKGCPLTIAMHGFMEARLAEFIAEGLLRSSLAERDAITLDVHEGSLDAACHWLWWAPEWGGGDRWAVRHGGACVALERFEDDRFRLLFVDLEGDDLRREVGTAASILSQLERLSPVRVEVSVPEGRKVEKRLLDTIAAARRLLPSVEKVRIVQRKR